MPEVMDLKNAAEELIASYETRVEDIGSLIDSAFFVLSDFQGAIVDAKEERKLVNHQLREALAKNEHLRKKDFDNMMKSILHAQEERERQIKQLLREYFNDEKAMAQGLRENLANLRDSLKVREYHRLLPFYNKNKERFEELGKYLISEITEPCRMDARR